MEEYHYLKQLRRSVWVGDVSTYKQVRAMKEANMAEQESNVCAVCGGIKHIELVSELGNGPQRTWRVVTDALVDGKWHLCWCHPESHPPHKYCPKCGLWRDMDGMHCAVCGTTLELKQLDSHPEPAQKHDGSLDEYGDGMVEISESRVVISHQDQNAGGFAPVEAVHLTPAQALSLLAWLKQNEPELERLAKEQEGE